MCCGRWFYLICNIDVERCCFSFVSELAACTGDVAATAGPDVDVDAFGAEDVLEGVDIFGFGAFVGESFYLVVADEVDVSADAFGDRGELTCVFGAIIDIAKEDVF